jgi:hypothetical protein
MSSKGKKILFNNIKEKIKLQECHEIQHAKQTSEFGYNNLTLLVYYLYTWDLVFAYR